MKIIYVNCGVKNYMKEDHRSYIRNFCSWEKKSLKKIQAYCVAVLLCCAKNRRCESVMITCYINEILCHTLTLL